MGVISTKFWIKISIWNLVIVSILGILMRYKIGFEFPYFDQKHLQYAHSHFAFYGWVSHSLMLLIIHYFKPTLDPIKIRKYNFILILNLICAYGMLISFALTGYGIISIIFSTSSIFISFAFAIYCFQDFTKKDISHSSILWFKASLIFNVISSIGTFALAIMMATKNIHQHTYLSSVYWYLHFQYNGWFFFACMGLFNVYIKSIKPEYHLPKSIFWFFALSCIPAYGLSILWLNLPIWIYIIVIFGAVAQSIGWIKLLLELKKLSFLKNFTSNNLHKFLFIAVAIALTIKFVLQLGSTIPSISKLAFGFRPIVIAYLHLVLLAIISVFILSYFYINKLISTNKTSKLGLLVIVVGVFLNELILSIQGIASFSYKTIPFVNEALLGITLFIFSGLVILFSGQFSKSYYK